MNAIATLLPAEARRTRSESVGRVVEVVLAPAVLLLVGVALVGAGGHDDSHITYWPAYALVEHGGVYNYNGEVVEQSSSLLHVLLLAALYAATGVPLPTLGLLTSVAFGVLTVIAVQRLAARVHPGLPVVVGLLTALSPFFVYWSFGGLETTLASFGMVWLAGAAWRYLEEAPSRRATGGALAALAFVLLVRPEAPFVCACLFAGLGALAVVRAVVRKGDVARSPALRRSAVLLAYTAVGSVSIAAVRLVVFGSAFPRPVYAKGGTVAGGLDYVAEWWGLTPLTAVIGAVALAALWIWLIRLPREGPSALDVAGLLVAVYVCFIVAVGGDWMAGGRMFVPVLPLAVLVLSWAVRETVGPGIPQIATSAALVVICGATIAPHSSAYNAGSPSLRGLWSDDLRATFQASTTEGGRVLRERGLTDAADFTVAERMNRIHVRDIPTIAALDAVVTRLIEADPALVPVTIASGQQGMVSYHTARRHFGDVDLVDLRGLTEPRLVECFGPGAPRIQTGLDITHQQIVRASRNGCPTPTAAVPEVDVVTDLVGQLDPPEGMVLVYIQDGTLRGLPPSHRIHAGQYVAVREDLVPLLGFEVPILIDVVR